MKVQSWPYLVLVTIVCGLGVRRCAQQGEIAMVILWLLLYFYCLFICFVPEAYEAERKRTDRCRRVEEEQFGRWAGLARWAGFLLYFAALAVAMAYPHTLYPAILPAGADVLYEFWYWRKYLKAVRKERPHGEE